MTQDVEMKEQPAHSNSVTSSSPSTLHQTGAYDREARRILQAIRLTTALRRKLKPSVLSSFLTFTFSPGSEALTDFLHTFLRLDVLEDEHEMEVDTATSGAQPPTKHSLPELEIYCYLLVLIFLIDQQKYDEAKACSSTSIARLKNMNRRTLDVLAVRLYFYYSLCYELTGSLAEIRSMYVSRIHDQKYCETLLNLLLRNFLHYNLYDQAEKLRSKAPRFEAHSNQQLRNLQLAFAHMRKVILCSFVGTSFTWERLRQSNWYTDIKECLLQAARKAPLTTLGFRVQCNEWAIIVRLLLGEIPERIVFMQKGMEKALRPYFELTNCPRQSGGTECGYYVCKFMKEIVENGLELLANKNVGDGNEEYTDDDIDDIRKE
ncbi:putative 26S proteasome non-ATPase regulatory subunit 3 [Hibiscus syriacus]|uniref:26S proteasome non-ATPase regulatory subunit 3 n=1 Tax=Hibiscus syriacus TaxID=106335 RepID=A0A6A2WXA0_HIBSY|nr:putative 26S proteasome non-ATPase regulatory subunit 3 [Hibiscus syriacus]